MRAPSERTSNLFENIAIFRCSPHFAVPPISGMQTGIQIGIPGGRAKLGEEGKSGPLPDPARRHLLLFPTRPEGRRGDQEGFRDAAKSRGFSILRTSGAPHVTPFKLAYVFVPLPDAPWAKTGPFIQVRDPWLSVSVYEQNDTGHVLPVVEKAPRRCRATIGWRDRDGNGRANIASL